MRCVRLAYPIGYVHIDIAEVRTEHGKLHLFVAIDRTAKFALARIRGRAIKRITSPRFAGVLQTAQVVSRWTAAGGWMDNVFIEQL